MLPTTVKVGPYIYSVSTNESELRREETNGRVHLRGCTDSQHLKIMIDATLAVGMQRQTLWHEVKHAIVDVLTMSNDKRSDEDWIARTAPMELAVMRENPSLLAFMLGED